SGVTAAHAFVIDGYRREGMWHVNWGGGGQSNGYYSLALLTPSAINDGDTNSGFNISQKLVKAVPPGADPGVVQSSMYGSLKKVSEGRYQVYYSGQGVAHDNVSLGAAIVAEGSENILEWIPFWTNQWLGASVSVRDYKNYDFTDVSLPAGNYRIYPAIIADGEDAAVICTESDGLQHYVALTVSPSGKYDIYNPESGVQSSAYELYLSELLTPILYSGYECELRYVLVNNGGADYQGTILLQLVPEGETIPVYQKTIFGNVISGGFNKLMSTVFYVIGSDGREIPAGRYNIRLTTMSGEDLLMEPSTETVTVVDEMPPGLHSGGGYTEVVNPTMMPTYLVKGGTWSHIPYINNEKEGRIKLDVVFCRQGTNAVIERHNIYDGEMGSFSGTWGSEPFTINLPFGIYDVMYEANNIDISERRKVYVGDCVDGLYYLPLSAGRAALCNHPDYGYSGEVTIKPVITVEGTSYTVTDIIESAFSRCQDLTTVLIPSTVTHIGRNAFAYCPNLQNVVFGSDDVPFTQRNHVMPGVDDSMAIYAPAESYDDYSGLLSSYQPVYAKIESIASTRVEMDMPTGYIDVAVNPAHPSINAEFTIEPADGGISPIEVTSAEVCDGKLRLAVTATGPGSARYIIRSAQPGVEPAVLEIVADALAGVAGIDADSRECEEKLYDMQGRRSDSHIGFRIVVSNGKAKVIKY
ncbi:MAG: leucine-rich repeat protein, partial [Paramuribaculum sp.]|nr:leucine-rich repeat protein [Paramuribaculum sp.]